MRAMRVARCVAGMLWLAANTGGMLPAAQPTGDAARRGRTPRMWAMA
jgi:hypothetical protein